MSPRCVRVPRGLCGGWRRGRELPHTCPSVSPASWVLQVCRWPCSGPRSAGLHVPLSPPARAGLPAPAVPMAAPAPPALPRLWGCGQHVQYNLYLFLCWCRLSRDLLNKAICRFSQAGWQRADEAHFPHSSHGDPRRPLQNVLAVLVLTAL